MDVDLLNERAEEIIKQADQSNKDRISSEAAEVSGEWAHLLSDLQSRRDILSQLASRWEEFEAVWQQFENAVTTCEDKSKHIDTVVRSKPHIIDANAAVKVNF